MYPSDALQCKRGDANASSCPLVSLTDIAAPPFTPLLGIDASWRRCQFGLIVAKAGVGPNEGGRPWFSAAGGAIAASICICIWICKRAKGLGWVDHQGQRPHPDQRVIDMQSLLLPQHCGISASFLFAHCNGATTTTATSTATANATTVATTDDDNNGISRWVKAKGHIWPQLGHGSHALQWRTKWGS